MIVSGSLLSLPPSSKPALPHNYTLGPGAKKMVISIADSRDMKTTRPACCLVRANAQSTTTYIRKKSWLPYVSAFLQGKHLHIRSAPDCLPVSGQLTDQVAFSLGPLAEPLTHHDGCVCDDGDDDDDDDDDAFSPPPAYPTYYLPAAPFSKTHQKGVPREGLSHCLCLRQLHASFLLVVG